MPERTRGHAQIRSSKVRTNEAAYAPLRAWIYGVDYRSDISALYQRRPKTADTGYNVAGYYDSLIVIIAGVLPHPYHPTSVITQTHPFSTSNRHTPVSALHRCLSFLLAADTTVLRHNSRTCMEVG